ncbi:fungal trichothecene efflux pump [Amylocarpus encephaloides]|uniref:Fungal trichothecene efflux pump n=1 Tax=Amylocarpus encephaloides TaxID=45428 RepID=A0A9P7YD62_9HELO|nr:fungal trichothecene efflux pump [Amylocarpus encephaloides]
MYSKAQETNIIVEKEAEKSTESSVHHEESLPGPLDPYEEDGPTKLNLQTILAFLSLCGQFNAYVMTLLIPSSTLSYINADLGPDPNYTWITVSWQLGASIIISVGGRLADIFGRRYFMLFGSCLGVVGCIVGATGQSINQMIASGIIFGIASGFQEMCYACIQEILPNKYRMAGVGAFDVTLLIAAFTPLISYAFIAHSAITWRAAYWYMTALHIFFLVILFFFYNPPDFGMKHRHDGKTKLQLLAELDYVGVFLFATSSTLFLVGINFGGRQFPWKSTAVIAPIVIGLFCAVLLGFWETKMHLKYPLLPPKLFKNVRGFVMVIVVCFVGGMLYYSMNVLWPRQSATLFVPATEPILRGMYATIFSLGSFTGGLIMLFFCSRVGHEKWQLVGFMIAQTALIGSLASVGIDSKAQAIATVYLASCMITPPQLISFTMLSLGLDDQTDIGIAVGLAGTFRLMGGAVATAIYTAILTQKFNDSIVDEIRAVVAQTGLPQSSMNALVAAAKLNTAAAYTKVPGISAAATAASQMAYKLAYVQAFKLVYLVAIGFGGIATIAAFCTVSTDKAMKNNTRAVVLKNEVNAAEVDETGKKV